MALCRAILAALLALMALPALGQEETVVDVWGLFINPEDKGTDELVRRFEAENPGIRIRLLGMGAGGMNPQKLMTSIVGGAPPDVIKQDRFTLADWASRNAFRPLDDLIERDRATDPRTPTPEQYYDAVWAETQYGGSTYGIPIGADDRVLYYNTAIFEEKADELRAAGLDPNRPPRTWSETLAYSKVLTEFDENGQLTRAGFMPNFGNSWLYIYSFMTGGKFLSEDGRTCTFSDPENQEALQFMKDGYDLLGGFDQAEKFRATFLGEENDPFLAGQVAMMINGDWILKGFYSYKPDMPFETAPPPLPDDRFHGRGRFAGMPEDERPVTWAGGWSYAIPRGAKNVEAAWKFIKWITSTEGRMIDMRGQQDYERSRGRRYIPGMQAQIKANEKAIQEFANQDTPFDRALKSHVEMMRHAHIRPTTFAGQVLWDEHVRATDRAMRGDVSVEQALQDAEVAVQRVLDAEYQKETYPVFNLAIPLYICLGLVPIGIVAWLLWLRSKKMGRLAKSETKWGYLLISPWLIGFLIFTFGPMVASLVFSFTQYNVLTEARWVGGMHYQALAAEDSDLILKAFGNVLFLAAVGVPLGIFSGLAIALLLNADVRGMRWYRTIYYLPSIVPAVVTVILWWWILNSDPSRGLMNALWQATLTEWTGTVPPSWFAEEEWTKPSLILMGLWGVGAGMILWLAGLKGVPKQLYEAAEIDGASPSQKLFSVTVPQLTPLIFFTCIMGFIGALQTFDQIYVITRGENAGPGDSLLVPVYHLFINGFKYFRMGYASALAWIIFLAILAITGLQFAFQKKWVHYEVDK